MLEIRVGRSDERCNFIRRSNLGGKPTIKDLLRHNNGHPIKIRLAGIDAPEKRQPFGERSKQSLAKLAFGKTVTVEYYKVDRYGRILGKVLVNGRDVNLEQVRLGMGWHYKQYEMEQSAEDRVAYAIAEVRARRERLGLWADTNAIAPWDWRAARRSRQY